MSTLLLTTSPLSRTSRDSSCLSAATVMVYATREHPTCSFDESLSLALGEWGSGSRSSARASARQASRHALVVVVVVHSGGGGAVRCAWAVFCDPCACAPGMWRVIERAVHHYACARPHVTRRSDGRCAGMTLDGVVVKSKE